MIWSLIQQIGGQAASLLIFAAFVAILRPRDIGLLVTAMVWINILAAFTEMGVGAAIIQRKDLRSTHLSTVFGLNVVTGIVLTILGMLLSGPAAWFFKSADIQPIMTALSFTFLIRAFGVTQSAVAQRELNFRALAIRDLVATTTSGVVGIWMAVSGYGVWSLVVLTLLGALLNVLLLWGLSPWRPQIGEMSWEAVSDLWPYSSRMLGFNLFKAVVQNADRIIVGHVLDPTSLGVYTFAYRMLSTPIKALVAATDSYVFPRAAHLQNDRDAVRSLYLRMNEALMSVVLPSMVGATALAPVLVPAIFGQEWLAAVPLMPLVAIVVVLQALISPIGQLMKALGRPGWMLAWSVFFTASIAGLMWIGARYGLVGATAGLLAANVLGGIVNLQIARRLMHLTYAEFARHMLPTVLSSSFMAALIVVLMRSSEAHPHARLVVGTIIGAAVYVLVLNRLRPALVQLFRERFIEPLRSVRLQRQWSGPPVDISQVANGTDETASLTSK